MNALTKRELQVADLTHQGLIEKEIGEKLFISQQTVHTHKKNIRRKLSARNDADITRIFLINIRRAIAVAVSLFAVLSLFQKQIADFFQFVQTSLIEFFK